MSARASTPTVWPLAEAMIRHRAGSDDQGDGSHGPFINQAVGVVARQLATLAREGISNDPSTQGEAGRLPRQCPD